MITALSLCRFFVQDRALPSARDISVADAVRETQQTSAVDLLLLSVKSCHIGVPPWHYCASQPPRYTNPPSTLSSATVSLFFVYVFFLGRCRTLTATAKSFTMQFLVLLGECRLPPQPLVVPFATSSCLRSLLLAPRDCNLKKNHCRFYAELSSLQERQRKSQTNPSTASFLPTEHRCW